MLQAPFLYSNDAFDDGQSPPYLPYGAAIASFDISCEDELAGDANEQVLFMTASRPDNVPAALIILLPLMALVLKALYPLSRRYYVEHLLFFVHFHAFFFLILTIQIFYSRLGALLSLPEAAVVLPVVAISFYIPVYLFFAMRTVYGQGKLITFIKYVALTVTYAAGFMATMLGALAIAAFSI